MNEEKTEITRPSDFNLQTDLSKQPCLIVMSGKDLARKHVVNLPEVIIGRGSDAHIIVKEHNVSRRHAKLTIKGDQARLEDLKSTNGTFVNSERISEVCDLSDGDLIGIGKTILKFSFQSGIDSAFHDEIYNSATIDELTTIFNRKYFQKHIESEFARVVRYGRDVSLLLLDIDDFKQVNDKFGHQAGDLVLRAVGKTIKSCVRNNVDIPARYGGEEFAILLPETGIQFAKRIGEKIRLRIEQMKMDYEGKSFKITISVGVSTNRNETGSPEMLVRQADENLYAAKRKGKNRVEGG